MSVSPPGQRRRKARDLNPHGLWAARFSKPARQPVSGYPPYRVDPAGVEPAWPSRQAGVVPLDHRPLFGQWRRWESNPTQGACEAPSPPRHMRPQFARRGPAGDRTRSSALTRAACGRNTSRPSSCGGRIRTGVGRLMRPCWEPGSSPLRSTPGRTRTCARLHVREVPCPLGYGGKRQ